MELDAERKGIWVGERVRPAMFVSLSPAKYGIVEMLMDARAPVQSFVFSERLGIANNSIAQQIRLINLLLGPPKVIEYTAPWGYRWVGEPVERRGQVGE